jgi:hypothetical protein
VRSLRLVPHGPLPLRTRYPEVKDPCPVFDGERWHLFGTGIGMRHGLELLHATAPAIEGPWVEHDAVRLLDVDHLHEAAAPGVIADGRRLHLFLQEHFNRLGGRIEHLVSDDGGRSFTHGDTALTSVAPGPEAGIYDPDPALIDGVHHLGYAAMSVVGEPDIHLARSASWDGPWQRVGRILGHADVDGHNQLGDDDYEWGLEGPQLTALPDGTVLLVAVCFLSGRARGHRQRILFATADGPAGPYTVLGPLLEPEDGVGENGHGAAFVAGNRLHVVYQERAGEGRPWHYRHASADIPDR